jgi:hypothetical protein
MCAQKASRLTLEFACILERSGKMSGGTNCYVLFSSSLLLSLPAGKKYSRSTNLAHHDLSGKHFVLCYVQCRMFEAFHDSLFFFLSKDGIASK